MNMYIKNTKATFKANPIRFRAHLKKALQGLVRGKDNVPLILPTLASDHCSRARESIPELIVQYICVEFEKRSWVLV